MIRILILTSANNNPPNPISQFRRLTLFCWTYFCTDRANSIYVCCQINHCPFKVKTRSLRAAENSSSKENFNLSRVASYLSSRDEKMVQCTPSSSYWSSNNWDKFVQNCILSGFLKNILGEVKFFWRVQIFKCSSVFTQIIGLVLVRFTLIR